MDHFSKALQAFIDTKFGGTTRNLAEATGLSDNKVSRIRRGLFKVQPDDLDAILRTAEPADQKKLIYAHLLDILPQAAREAFLLHRPRPIYIAEDQLLDERVATILDAVARETIHSPPLLEFVLMIPRLMNIPVPGYDHQAEVLRAAEPQSKRRYKAKKKSGKR